MIYVRMVSRFKTSKKMLHKMKMPFPWQTVLSQLDTGICTCIKITTITDFYPFYR